MIRSALTFLMLTGGLCAVALVALLTVLGWVGRATDSTRYDGRTYE